ncbi:MAG: hypothetical protein AAFQ64_05945 [Pseudomonadota bacterium]
MSVKAAAEKSYETLKNALADGRFPANVADTAVKLCHRLNEPVRVGVMGLPGSGKSTLVNLLLNKVVIPQGISLPTTQFLKGETTRAICTLEDGTTTQINGADAHEIASLSPIFVEMQMSLPALGRISVLEVVAPADAKDQQRAMHWAAKRTDMAIWCSKQFTPIEQALWSSLPDEVKDHSFMLLTCADQLAQDGKLEQTLEEIRFGAGHEFNKIMPIATTDAIASRRSDGSVDKALMKKSGGLTLISTILRQVDQGLQATVDQADLIFHKFKDAEPNADNVRIVEILATPRAISKPIVVQTAVAEAAHAEAAAASPVVEVVSSKPVVNDASDKVAATRSEVLSADAFVLRGKSAMISAADAPKAAAPAPTPAPEPETEPEAPAVEEPEAQRIGKPVAPVAPTKPDAPKKARPGFMPKAKTSVVVFRAKPETCAAFEGAITYLEGQGQALSAQASDLTSEALMEASADNITWLTDHLDAVDVIEDPVLEKNRMRALDASELIQLMQFEDNDDAGIEALTLVVQLKRDLESALQLTRHHTHVKAA